MKYLLLLLFNFVYTQGSHYYDGHFFINVEFDKNIKSKGAFIFDTGSSNCYIDSTFILTKNILNNIEKHTVNVMGVLGDNVSEINLYKAKHNIKILGSNYQLDSVYTYDLKKIGGVNIDGIIGIDILKDKKVKLDYKKGVIKISNNFSSTNKNFNCIEFDLVLDKIVVPFKIKIKNEWVSLKCVLDTGSNAFATLTQKKETFFKGLEKKTYFSSNSGVGGNYFCNSYLVDNLYFGNETYIIPNEFKSNNLIDILINKNGLFTDNETFDGVVGNLFLENYLIIIDFKNQKIYYKKNKSKKKKQNLNFTIIKKDNKTYVKGIYFESIYYQRGLRINDEIIEVNNNEIGKLSTNRLYKLLQKKCKLKIERNGSQIKI